MSAKMHQKEDGEIVLFRDFKDDIMDGITHKIKEKLSHLSAPSENIASDALVKAVQAAQEALVHSTTTHRTTHTSTTTTPSTSSSLMSSTSTQSILAETTTILEPALDKNPIQKEAYEGDTEYQTMYLVAMVVLLVVLAIVTTILCIVYRKYKSRRAAAKYSIAVGTFDATRITDKPQEAYA